MYLQIVLVCFVGLYSVLKVRGPSSRLPSTLGTPTCDLHMPGLCTWLANDKISSYNRYIPNDYS